MDYRRIIIELLKLTNIDFTESSNNYCDTVGTIKIQDYIFNIDLKYDYAQPYIVVNYLIPIEDRDIENVMDIEEEINERFIVGKCKVENDCFHLYTGFALINEGWIEKSLNTSITTMLHMIHGCMH